MNTEKKQIKGCKQIVICTLGGSPAQMTDIPLFSLIHEAVTAVDLNVIRTVVQRFNGGGKTLVAVLAESHLVVETFPEHDLVELEIASCRKIDASKLDAALKGTEFEVKEIAGLIKGDDGKWTQGL